MGGSHQGPIDYIEPKSTRSINMSRPYGCPSTITPAQTPQSTHIIPSDEESILSVPLLPTTTYFQSLPPSPLKVTTTKPIDETFHKNLVEPLFICTLNIVHNDATNLPLITPSSTQAPCKNRTQFGSLNLHKILGFRQFCNKKHLTAPTNASLVSPGLL